MEQVVVEQEVDQGWAEGEGDSDPLSEQAVCLAIRSVRLSTSYISLDGRRRIYVFQAPDAESVRAALRSNGLSLESTRIWTARRNAAPLPIPR